MFNLVDAAAKRLAEDNGGGPTPKNSTGPGIVGVVTNFFNRLSGKAKKDAQFSTVLPGAVVTRAWTLEVVQLARVGLANLEAAGAILGRAGVWSLPLMLNGDSQFFANSKPMTGIGDIPITTTDSEPEQTMTLFRGVHGKHPDLANAYMGIAIPLGGPFSALDHNRGHNNSMFTSWTTSIEMANYLAFRRGPGGIILKQSFPTSRLSFFDSHGEGEVQVFGTIFGA